MMLFNDLIRLLSVHNSNQLAFIKSFVKSFLSMFSEMVLINYNNKRSMS